MKEDIFPNLGEQLKRARTSRNLTQPELGRRIGRDRARISELERDLIRNRLGRDRLTLLAEICDALDLVPMLVPRARALEIRAIVGGAPERRAGRPAATSTFDEVFVDLGDGPEED